MIAKSVKDILKPKPESDIDFSGKPLSYLYDVFLNSKYWWHNPIKGEPIIFTLDREAEKYYKDCGDLGPFDRYGRRPWNTQYTEPPIGVRFNISDAMNIIVEQFDGEDFVWVYPEYAKYVTDHKFQVTTFEQLKNAVSKIQSIIK